ncbi:radical SAM protein [uncultured Gemmiger sp.]|uniref:radical SAM protein n=1 Tax=uncultured Gemmiger sp. TaxID=1623490 RepID=UPI002805F72F|nr:radical SAM protein [uncultured Gemmiger sp.]
MKYLSYGERAFLRGHLNRVRHVTLDPDGPGVVRIHLIPCTKPDRDTPFVAILNGQDILPLNLSWAILLTNLIEALQPHAGTELKDSDWSAINAQAVAATRKIYRKTEPLQIESDLQMMLDTLIAVAQGKEPPLHIQPISLAQYAPRMAAPHRMDLMISTMVKDNAWHCNQKCLHCYAANQPLSAVPEMDTDQWLAVIEKCRGIGIPQLTFTGGEPTLRQDLVKLVQAAQWFVTRLNTNGRMLTSALCKDLRAASLDAVQITFYSADEAVHNELVGVDGYTDTVNGIKNALAAGLNVSLNTPLCSLNKDYRATVEFAYDLGIRYLTCSGLIPAGNAAESASKSVRLTPEELTEVLRPAMDFALSHGMEVNFTSPGWLDEDTLTGLGFTQIPSCGACLSNMAVAPDGTVLPCQSWLTGHGLGHILRTPWNRIWRSPECCAIRMESARMKRLCQLGDTPMQEGF